MSMPPPGPLRARALLAELRPIAAIREVVLAFEAVGTSRPVLHDPGRVRAVHLTTPELQCVSGDSNRSRSVPPAVDPVIRPLKATAVSDEDDPAESGRLIPDEHGLRALVRH